MSGNDERILRDILCDCRFFDGWAIQGPFREVPYETVREGLMYYNIASKSKRYWGRWNKVENMSTEEIVARMEIMKCQACSRMATDKEFETMKNLFIKENH